MQVHALRACFLLVIPPPKEGGPPPGGFSKDLSDLNLSSWTSLVQDVDSGLMAPLPTLGSKVSLGNASATHNDTVRTPDNACLTAMPEVACYTLPTSGATAKKTCGWGVIADTPTDKTTPMGGTTQDHGRPAARGQAHGSHSVSHPRGIPEMASALPQCQEGGLPSGSMPSGSLPPPPAPERTQPRWGGQTRSALHDPVWLAVNFCSSGWKKDLKHILKVYYQYSVDYFTEGDWSWVKERFFDLFLQNKKEALEVKEARPLDFMAYIQDLFYQATGLHLDGLGSFTWWIKRESYHHGIVAQQGHLQECPHLAGAPLPRWPQVTPSESHWESQMRSDAQVHSSSRPSAGTMVVPIAVAPVAEAPAAEAPVAEVPVAEAAVMEETPAEAPIVPPFPQGEQVMVHHGLNRWRQLKKSHSSGAGQLNVPTPCLGGVS